MLGDKCAERLDNTRDIVLEQSYKMKNGWKAVQNIRNEYKDDVSKFSISDRNYVKRQYTVTYKLLAYRERNLIRNSKIKTTPNHLEIFSDEDETGNYEKSFQHEVLSLSSESDSLCSASNTLPRSITCQTSEDVIINMVNTYDTNIVQEPLLVQSHESREVSYPEFYT